MEARSTERPPPLNPPTLPCLHQSRRSRFAPEDCSRLHWCRRQRTAGFVRGQPHNTRLSCCSCLELVYCTGRGGRWGDWEPYCVHQVLPFLTTLRLCLRHRLPSLPGMHPSASFTYRPHHLTECDLMTLQSIPFLLPS